jgi:hypothetical protein
MGDAPNSFCGCQASSGSAGCLSSRSEPLYALRFSECLMTAAQRSETASCTIAQGMTATIVRLLSHVFINTQTAIPDTCNADHHRRHPQSSRCLYKVNSRAHACDATCAISQDGLSLTFPCCCFSPNSVERFMTSCGARISHIERAPLLTMIPLPPTARLSAAMHRNSHSAPFVTLPPSQPSGHCASDLDIMRPEQRQRPVEG